MTSDGLVEFIPKEGRNKGNKMYAAMERWEITDEGAWFESNREQCTRPFLRRKLNPPRRKRDNRTRDVTLCNIWFVGTNRRKEALGFSRIWSEHVLFYLSSRVLFVQAMVTLFHPSFAK